MLQQHGLNENNIRELYLYKIPVLKNCENWALVKEIGLVEFKGKHALYNGALVSYGEKVFYIPHSRIEALSPYRKWKFRNKINVITEVEFKKKKK